MDAIFNLKETYSQVKQKKIKFIIITGGVLSGLGKGVTIASMGALISNKLVKTPIKCDGYLNFDPGTMNPIEHGEVFVLDDGTEVDMDFGHYERFLNITCDGNENLTMGKIYKEIIDLEREGKFLGKTVKLIPEVTDYIENKILRIALNHKSNIVLLEIGGTVGDIENELYLVAARNIIYNLGIKNAINVHLTYIPELFGSCEQKTKPAQNGIEKLYNRGIRPDIIICRTKRDLDIKSIDKLSTYTGLDKGCIISAKDVNNIYDLPIYFKTQNLDKLLSKKLNLKVNKNNLEEYEKRINIINRNSKTKKEKENIKIGICGKYTSLNDSYASVVEALNHASIPNNIHIDIDFIDTEKLDINYIRKLNGIIIPGGFGTRGIEGKIKIIKYARENNIPLLGLCYGLQLSIIEFARNKCNLKDANTTEIDINTKNPIITILPGQNLNKLGGTMRLGSYKANLKEGSKISKIYNSKISTERHRHRYEVNPAYHEILEKKGMILSGFSPNKQLVEYIELKDHPFFVGTQAHPELKSRILNPHPLFVYFVKASKENRPINKKKLK